MSANNDVIYSKVPLGLARSALFGTSSTKGKEQVEISLLDASIPAQKCRETRIRYTGPALNQHHALLWQSIISVYVEQNSPIVEISGNELLRRMGNKSECAQMHRRLAKMLLDLRRGEIKYSTQTHDYYGGLVSGVSFAKVNFAGKVRKGDIKIQINNELSALFADEVLVNDLSRKAQLGNNQLAQWLHDFILTHKTMPPIDLEELRCWTRSNFEMKKFKFSVKKALDLLSADECKVVKSYQFNRRGQLVVDKYQSNVVILDKYRSGKANCQRSTNKKDEAIAKARNLKGGVNL
ncbi:hypothetical protein [Xanthomonas cannabis]|uniref:hypothetical protein n=1 Tax=Xanthomonas cannabis TaxID=1885674 RepID=UPI001111CC02|nr:hypothetical protein [Xanthomonas cannabis]